VSREGGISDPLLLCPCRVVNQDSTS
jgi:hypothetical protein